MEIPLFFCTVPAVCLSICVGLFWGGVGGVFHQLKPPTSSFNPPWIPLQGSCAIVPKSKSRVLSKSGANSPPRGRPRAQQPWPIGWSLLTPGGLTSCHHPRQRSDLHHPTVLIKPANQHPAAATPSSLTILSMSAELNQLHTKSQPLQTKQSIKLR